jgi:plasmid stabilization system protein ParE
VSAIHRVRWTPEAESDAATIVDWFNDPINATKVIDQFAKKASSLERMPGRGRVVPELREIGVLQFLEIPHKPWRMIYAIHGREVWIMAIIDGRRKLGDLLYERFSK